MRKFRLTTDAPESPATLAFLEDLKWEFERRDFKVDRISRRVNRPGTLSPDMQTVMLILAATTLAANSVSAVFQVLQYFCKPPGAAATHQVPLSQPPLPIVIRVRFHGQDSDRFVNSLEEAKQMDVTIEGLPEDRHVEIIVERQHA